MTFLVGTSWDTASVDIGEKLSRIPADILWSVGAEGEQDWTHLGCTLSLYTH